MLKLLKYLKPFWISVVLILGLTYTQVQLELKLPDYMSDIVTNGIQNGGIKDASMEAISEDTFDKISYFVNDDELTILKDSYQYIEQNNASYINKYPILNTEGIYLLKDTKTNISSIISKPLVIVSMLDNQDYQSSLNLPSNIFSLLQQNPQMAQTIKENFDQQTSQYTDSNIDAMALKFVSVEYQKIGININTLETNYILNNGLKMLGVAFLGALCAVIIAFASSKVGAKVAANLRKDVFTKVENFSSFEFSKFSTASLITRTTNDVQQVQQVMTMMLRIVIYAPLMGIGAIVKVFRYKSMLWIILLVLSIILVVLIVTFIITLPKFKVIQKLVDRLNLVTREALSGMLVIRAFNTQKHEEAKFDKANTDITNINLFVNRTMASVMPIMNFIMSSVSILIIWVGAKQIDLGSMHIGEMMAFLQYVMNILMSFIMVAMISIMLPRSSVSANRILEIINTDSSIQDPLNPKELPNKISSVKFNHVYFKYPNAQEYVLEDINFIANPKETIAFIGSTGSGKSTLINLIPRFFDVTKGSIEISNIDIKDITQHDLHSIIGYIPQKATLFKGDIESNLKYGDQDASIETINRAIEISQSKEFIETKTEGLQTSVSQGGTNLSGGQKQRLSIARALSKKSDILIFDDSFSALDYATDAALREALNKYIKETNTIVFIVAQRISTIMNADKIIVLDQGKVVGNGTHKELLNNCEVYKEIAYSQLSKEELAHE